MTQISTRFGAKRVSDGEALIERTPFAIEHPVLRNMRKTGNKPGRKKSSSRVFDTWQPDIIGGERRFRCIRERAYAPLRNQPGFPSFRKTGTPCGMTKTQVRAAWARAYAIAEVRLEELRRQKLISDDELSRRAMKVLLALAECDAVQPAERNKAARSILEFSKTKPSAPVAIISQPPADVQLPGLQWLKELPSPTERKDG